MLEDLLDLAHFLAAPGLEMCLLAEGNVSGRCDETCFWVKGSGQEMAAMSAQGFSRIDSEKLAKVMYKPFSSDEEIRAALNATCLEGPPPSTETFMHGLLLGQPGIHFVAHTHPTSLLSLLCLPGCQDWAARRLFPDEIVCCGPATCFVPYVAPGLELARAIARESALFQDRHGVRPKLYWLENHGMIAVGASCREVKAACLMAVKAARVLLGALQTGHEPKWLTDAEIAHIYNWPDEHARQRALFGG
jgi:rhamnose utilization protein RhaD (predicted bifunctional aldolase and dehydrogenase)